MTRFFFALLVGLLAAPAFAQVAITEAWVRATVPMQKATGAFMQLSAKQNRRLVEAKSVIAAAVEIHEMTMEDNIMRMRAIQSLDLPAGTLIELKPGGYHVMLIGLKQQVKERDLVPITLIFEDANNKRESVELNVPARALNSMPSKDAAHR